MPIVWVRFLCKIFSCGIACMVAPTPLWLLLDSSLLYAYKLQPTKKVLEKKATFSQLVMRFTPHYLFKRSLLAQGISQRVSHGGGETFPFQPRTLRATLFYFFHVIKAMSLLRRGPSALSSSLWQLIPCSNSVLLLSFYQL